LPFYIRDSETNQEIVMSSRPVLPTFDSHINGLKEAIATLDKAIKGGKDADKGALTAEKARVEKQLAAVIKQKDAAKA
jgi:hypothetical protein